jgi:hypothetical protein
MVKDSDDATIATYEVLHILVQDIAYNQNPNSENYMGIVVTN